MKILAINGSYRGVRGQTQHIIDLIFQGAASAGAVCESIALATIKMKPCIHCNQCQRSAMPLDAKSLDGKKIPDYEVVCVFQDKDDVESVFKKMREADLIIYATPVYVFNISTLLKILIDRFYGICYSASFRVTKAGLMFHHIQSQTISKPFVSLIVCDNLENETPKTMQSYFESFSKFLDAPMVGKLLRNAGALYGYGMDPIAEQQFPKIIHVYQAYIQAGYELATIGKIRKRTQRIANQEIIPVPFFGLIKRSRFYPIKQKFVERASEMRSKSMND